jgi:hypothetical protein
MVTRSLLVQLCEGFKYSDKYNELLKNGSEDYESGHGW